MTQQRTIGRYTVGGGDTEIPASVTGRTRMLARLRQALGKFCRDNRDRSHVEEVQRDIAERIAQYEKVARTCQAIALFVRSDAYREVRDEFIARADVERDRMADNTIRVAVERDMTGLVAALDEKLTRGLFEAFERAAKEFEISETRRQAEIAKLSRQETGQDGST